MIQEWQDDGEPYENKHKKEIIALSCDASVVSKYTAYVAVDEAQNKPVSGSMQGYELTADEYQHIMMLSTKMLQNTRATELSVHSVTLSARPPISTCCGGTSSPQLRQRSSASQLSRSALSSNNPSAPAAVPPKQLDHNFIVGLQQANGSWLLNDQLAGAISKS